jgi:hypothetical protein
MRIRRLASAIFTAAVRRAAPRDREWGNAMLREMDFAEDDWAALCWAIGSATTLLKHSEVPTSEPSAIVSQLQVLTKKVRRRTLAGYTFSLAVMVAFERFFFVFHNTLQRVGSALTVAGLLYWIYQVYYVRNRTLPSEPSPAVCTAFYRAELARQRDFHRGIWFWSRLLVMVPGYILFLIGFTMAYPRLARGLAMIGVCFLLGCVLAVPINLRLSRRYQRQMDELDALPKGS